MSEQPLADMKGKKVLVTGGLGFIGSNLARKCVELGAQVAIYDCLDPKSGGNMFNIDDIQNSIDLNLNDIRNFDGISACIRNKDILFNCAAYTSHPNSMREPLIDIDVNCKGVINILEAARRFNPDVKIIHVGTSTQLGKMHANPMDEMQPEFPRDIYSANKTVSEKYVLIYGSAYNMRTSVIRLANVFGPRSNIVSHDFGFMNYFIGLALQGKEISVFGDGSQMRNVTYVSDCVEAFVLAAQSERSLNHVLFAVADKHYSIRQIAEAITKNIGGKVHFSEWPKDRKNIEIGDAVISNHKIKEMLGWSQREQLESGLVKTRDYFKSCLSSYLK